MKKIIELVSNNELSKINRMNETLLYWKNYFPPFFKKSG